MRGGNLLRGNIWGGRFGGGPSTSASIAINKSLAPLDVVVLEGEATDAAVIGADVLVVGRDFKFW